MKLSDFDYELPKELIAQTALPKRSEARLLILDRERQSMAHGTFREMTNYFEKGDVLVLNDTKVLPARLFAKRNSGGRVEILLLKEMPSYWEALVKPSARIREGEELKLDQDSGAKVQLLDPPHGETGLRRILFKTDQDIKSLLNKIGRIPLPPYIDREDTPVDRELYQTVFAKRPGAVASPTAGLHFDEALLERLETRGVEILFITLHVSYGTFQPVASDDLARHEMYEEYFEIPDDTAERINFAKADGRRITACGTTVVRALESSATNSFPSEVKPKEGMTNLFLYPPYQFRIVDRMMTNFHLPRTTLLMLASAFAGHELLMCAYREAIEHRYRFYSYGDAMFIV